MDFDGVLGYLPLATKTQFLLKTGSHMWINSEVPFQWTVSPTAGEGRSSPSGTGDTVDEKGLIVVVGWGRAQQWAIPSHRHKCNWSTTHNCKRYLQWSWKGNKYDTALKHQPYRPPFGEKVQGDTEPFSFAAQASQIVCPKCRDTTILPDIRHEFSSKILMEFSDTDSKTRTEWAGYQECCCFFLWEIFAGTSPETSRFRMESWKWYIIF